MTMKMKDFEEKEENGSKSFEIQKMFWAPIIERTKVCAEKEIQIENQMDKLKILERADSSSSQLYQKVLLLNTGKLVHRSKYSANNKPFLESMGVEVKFIIQNDLKPLGMYFFL